MLRGKHLYIMELAWRPYATPDDTAPGGWSGLNIDIMNEVAQLLGFNYTIVDIGYPNATQSWTQHAIASIDKGDMAMSFWVKNTERVDHFVMLEGQFDVSPGLVARREKLPPHAWWSWVNLTKIFLPFTWPLWGGLVMLVSSTSKQYYWVLGG